MLTVGFLHTSPVHVPTFDALVSEVASDAAVVSVVEESLLDLARAEGPDAPAVVEGVERALADLEARGADVVICTCSTIGGTAEMTGRSRGVRAMRVDRPMANLAVARARRIGVVAALESTVEPTLALLNEAAATAGRAVVIDVHVADGAWGRFEADDRDGYLDVIAATVSTLAAACDLIVLAQASMADVAALVDVDVPVLSSPRTAVEWAVST